MTSFVSGLDLGLINDFSALATLERSPAPEPTRKRRWFYRLRWLETWDLGTRYTETREGERSVCGDVKARFDTDALRWSKLAVDFTGVGTAVVDQLRAAKVTAYLNPVLITSGHQIARMHETKERAWHVPKKELVATLMALLQSGLLAWPRPPAKPRTAFEKVLVRFERELADFRVKVTKSRNETFEADKSQHDDLVLACMLACWLGENAGAGAADGIGVPGEGQGSVTETAPPGVFLEG
jgi:hypothetical protein